MNRKEAKAKWKRFYIGKPCPACWGRRRYTSDGSCKDCRAARACDRRDLSPADLAALRITEAARKRAQRAKDSSPLALIYIGLISKQLTAQRTTFRKG